MIEEAFLVARWPAAVVRHLHVSTHTGRAGEAIACGPPLARHLDRARIHESLQGAPYGRLAHLRHRVTANRIPAGVRMGGEIIQDGLRGIRHEAIIKIRDTINYLKYSSLLTSQGIVSESLK